jgi:hypothetical protein
VAHSNRGRGEVDVRPVRVHDLLLAHPRHQEKLIPESLLRFTLCEQLVEFFLLVDLRFLLCVPRPVVLAYQPANPIRLQERHDILKLVVDAAWSLLLLVTEERGELQQVLPLDLVEAEFVAGFGTKYERAVEYAACVFGFFVSLVSSRKSATAMAIDLCPPWQSGTTVTPLLTAFNSASLRWRRALASAGIFAD